MVSGISLRGPCKRQNVQENARSKMSRSPSLAPARLLCKGPLSSSSTSPTNRHESVANFDRKKVTAMTQLRIEISDALARRLAWLASEQKKSVEQVAVEQLESLLEPAVESPEEKYERFFQQSGLFVERLAEEKQRYQAVSEARLKELAAKLGAAGHRSDVIVAERDLDYCLSTNAILVVWSNATWMRLAPTGSEP